MLYMSLNTTLFTRDLRVYLIPSCRLPSRTSPRVDPRSRRSLRNHDEVVCDSKVATGHYSSLSLALARSRQGKKNHDTTRPGWRIPWLVTDSSPLWERSTSASTCYTPRRINLRLRLLQLQQLQQGKGQRARPRRTRRCLMSLSAFATDDRPEPTATDVRRGWPSFLAAGFA